MSVELQHVSSALIIINCIYRSPTYDFILTGKTYDFTMVSSHMSHAGIGTAVSFLVSDPSNCVYDRVGYF